MSKKVRHIHARRNETVVVHRHKRRNSGSRSSGGLMIIGIIVAGVIIYSFWEIILACLIFGALAVGLAWLIIHYHKEIWQTIKTAGNYVTKCCHKTIN